MADNESTEPEEERELKSKELEMRVEHYKHYISIALQANGFYYVTTGGVLGFYLRYANELPIPGVEFFLLLPILFGSVLGGIFLYGSWLQAKAVEDLNDVRDELRNRLGLSVRRFHDAHLLVILLLIFGIIFFFVVVGLLILPFLLGRVIPSESFTLVFPTKLSNIQIFYNLAIIIIFLGLLIPLIAHLLDIYLKWRRNTTWLRAILRAKLWLEADKSGELDISGFKERNFYHAVRPFLDKQILECIDKNDRRRAKTLLAEKIDEFFDKSARKHKLKQKILEKIQAEVELEKKMEQELLKKNKVVLHEFLQKGINKPQTEAEKIVGQETDKEQT